MTARVNGREYVVIETRDNIDEPTAPPQPTPPRAARPRSRARRTQSSDDTGDGDGEPPPAWALELGEKLDLLLGLVTRARANLSGESAPQAYKPREAAQLLGVSMSTLKERIRAGKIRTVQIGGEGHPRIPSSELRRQLAPPHPQPKPKCTAQQAGSRKAPRAPAGAPDGKLEADRLRALLHEEGGR